MKNIFSILNNKIIEREIKNLLKGKQNANYVLFERISLVFYSDFILFFFASKVISFYPPQKKIELALYNSFESEVVWWLE